MKSHTMFKHILEVYDLSIAYDEGEWDVVAINKFTYEKSFLTNTQYTAARQVLSGFWFKNLRPRF